MQEKLYSNFHLFVGPRGPLLRATSDPIFLMLSGASHTLREDVPEQHYEKSKGSDYLSRNKEMEIPEIL